MTSKIDRLLFSRRRIINDIETQCKRIEDFNDKTPPTVLVGRKTILEELFGNFKANCHDIENSKGWLGDDEYLRESSNIHGLYCDACDHITQFLPINAAAMHETVMIGRREHLMHEYTQENVHVELNDPPGDEQHDDVNDTVINQYRPTGLSTNIKLPPLHIKPFTGDKLEWPEFKSSCETAFQTIPNESTRFQYLRGHLIGEPARLIRHIPIQIGSYARAWEILTKRYDNERAIINANLCRLIDCPEIKYESTEALKNMLNITNECIAAVNSFGIDTSTWYPFIILLLSKKLDSTSIKHWEERIQGQKTIPELEKFLEFLEIRINILETTMIPHVNPQLVKPKRVHLNTGKPIKCTICTNNHRAFTCPQLIEKTTENRKKFLIDKKLCTNCLFPHKVEDCTSAFSCRHCGQRHNTLLHAENSLCTTNDLESEPEETLDPEELQAIEMERIHFGHVQPTKISVKSMLPTAMVRIKHQGRSMLFRALLDQGSMADIITRRACEALSLPQWDVDMPMTGVGEKETCRVNKRTYFEISPHYSNTVTMGINAYILPHITTLRMDPPNLNVWTHLQGLQLADPKTSSNKRIDLLLSTATLSDMLLGGIRKGERNHPIAQRTSFGWIVSGKSGVGPSPNSPICSLIISDEALATVLQRFWESEEIPKNYQRTPNEQLAEELYRKTTKRCKDGRYMVKLPFHSDPTTSIGESLHIAKHRYSRVQQNLSKKPELQMTYNKCLDEYLDLGHMELTDENKRPRNYLPHHPVIKESSTTTKVRPVYDASCKTSNGNSLNSQLLVGPTIQPDLFSLMIRWRKYKYAITGDIEKMYRQVWVYPEDSEYQRILHKPLNSDRVESYRLKTVTFGVSSAPFLAIRTLYQIGEDIKSTNPDLAEQIQNHFYVDDYFESTDNIPGAKHNIQHMTNTLAEYGFKLRKWKSNDSLVLAEIPESEREESTDELSTFKTLGIQWQPSNDQFIFLPTELSTDVVKWTKRKILSDIAKLFDPLGWLSPCVILAKIFMQGLWLLPVDWDTELPIRSTTEWLQIRTQFTTSYSVKIPRWLGLKGKMSHVSLQGFADASERAYASVIYIRIEHSDGSINCNLIAAKTKVAPLKKVSLPKLELNAAVLLSQLMDKVKTALKIEPIESYAWTDSTIVLCWLADHPNRWKTYVANRVAEIQTLNPSIHWNHVKTTSNPADCASRGLNRNQLEKFELWWQGPKFLMQRRDNWSVFNHSSFHTNLEERKQTKALHVNIKPNRHSDIILRFSNYSFMLRVVKICLNWAYKHRAKFEEKLEPPTITEVELQMCKCIQNEAFGDEIRALKQVPITSKVDAKSSIRNLDPIFKDGLLRVGGRIDRASLTENEKHPKILPAKNHFTTLLIRHEHYETLHGGVALTLQKIRQRFWIINGKVTVNSVIRRCLTCYRFKRKLLTQKMGNLPAYRLQENIPFTFTGVDYAGYFEIKSSTRRNAPFIKGYIALFLCLTTRAVHLELVCDLSTTQYLKAFKRFIGRRGLPSNMYSDNGTNFIGAAREIQQNLNGAIEQSSSELGSYLLEKRIKWHFIPARAPHFGGWESGVKLVKHHLKRVLGNIRLTFEDFNTVIIEIEAIVNSRPLWSIPNQNDEYEALTPGHFLVFRALNALPEPNVLQIPSNRLNQYQYLCRLTSDFWQLWSREYIHQLQIRKKWQVTEPNVRENQIVLVTEDNELPTYWSRGRIINVICGEDGLVRVADVLSRGKVIRRPIHKLSLLPISDNDQSLNEPFKAGENGTTRR